MAMPEKKFRAGAVAATIWKNQGQNKMGQPVEFKTIQLDRRYTTKEGEWKSTNTFRINDLPKIETVVREAYKYLVLRDGSQASEGTPNNSPENSDFVDETEEIVI